MSCSHLLSQMTGSVWRVLYFVEKHGIVKRQTETNGMSWRHLLLGNVQRRLVGLLRLGNNICRKQRIAINVLNLISNFVITNEHYLLPHLITYYVVLLLQPNPIISQIHFSTLQRQEGLVFRARFSTRSLLSAIVSCTK